MYRLTGTDDVIRTSDGLVIPDDPSNTDWQAFEAWLEAGGQPEPAPAVDPLPQYGAAIQAHLDAQAGALGFDNIFTAVTYADEPVIPRFQRDGRALRAWRSLVWAAVYATLDAVQAGQRPIPTIPELIASLPTFTPPEPQA